ncbi:MAG: glycerophosphodiester phosphodiesterase family protein [Anaerolineae bacterium]|nr:glycerophosphodiester phosphodiesterase family protein [Anaerolineae bacterium]
MIFFQPNRPLNLAHRGANRMAPENTLRAFRLALEQGADGLELDVHLSRDGVPVVLHDADLRRTTNGSGWVWEKTVAELKALDAGGWMDPRFAGERIPTLEEVFEAFGKRALYNIELKAFTPWSAGWVRAVVERVRGYGLTDRVLLSSFNPLALRWAWRMAPEIPRGLLVGPELPLPLRRAWLAFLAPHQARHLHFRMIDDRTVGWCHQRGYEVVAWTVNETAEMRRLIHLGVAAIITDEPDRLARLLAEQEIGNARRALRPSGGLGS